MKIDRVFLSKKSIEEALINFLEQQIDRILVDDYSETRANAIPSNEEGVVEN
jgi:hypothetical protein